MIKTIDTFIDYINAFNTQPQSIEEKIQTWESYIKQYPELEFKMKNDYTQENIDWYTFASEKVFNRQEEDYPKMLKAYEFLQTNTPLVIDRVKELYGLEFDINIVYYAGLCNSAGWVDHYDDQLAVLIGLDKIAELNWHHQDALETLMAHELCHALHFNYRGIDIVDSDFSPSLYDQGIWNIYEEGFAKYFERTLVSKVNGSRGEQWMSDCDAVAPQLKKDYLEALADKTIGTRDFYGDWWQVRNLSDTGYYLGAKMIENLNKTMDIKTIACLSKTRIIKEVIKYLNS